MHKDSLALTDRPTDLRMPVRCVLPTRTHLQLGVIWLLSSGMELSPESTSSKVEMTHI
jgi:hypothetical protein